MKEQAAKKKKADDMGDLEKMILAKRENNFNGFLNYMESKYGQDEDEEV